MKILIIDDEEEALILLKSYLNDGGFHNIVTADSAKKGFEILGLNEKGNSKKMTATAVDVILMDILMPVMDGVEACRKIKQIEWLQHVPVIMITAKKGDEALAEGFQAGAVDYIMKPINRIELQARVRSALKLKEEMDKRKAREEELEKAMSEIKTLSGLLPICCYCKNIRDDKGYWQKLEKYIGDHSDAQFTHGICNDCMEKITIDTD